MAEVLLALMEVEPGINTTVVLKRIWPDLAEDHDFVTMFRDEAWLATCLNHPNVVRGFELIDDGKQLAIAMEYLHGQPLAAVLKRVNVTTDLGLPLRLRIVFDILSGLHYAHGLAGSDGALLNVVHRDVNPENVFVTYGGKVKLMDFGVAQTAISGLRTRPGTLKGKLSYIAPECVRGGVLDRRADVFAVGIMLWELLAGRRLWRGMGEAQIIHHLAAGMPIPGLPEDFERPPELDQICARALAVDPNDRYPTAGAMRKDLRRLLAGDATTHAHDLGRVVSGAFTEARAEREAMIERALDAGTTNTPSRPWVTEINALLPSEDGFFDETVVDEWEPPLEPLRAARRARVRVAIAGAVSVAVALGLGLVVARAQRDGGDIGSRDLGGQVAAAVAPAPAPPAAPPAPAPGPPAEAALPAIPTEDPPVRTGSFAPVFTGLPPLRAGWGSSTVPAPTIEPPPPAPVATTPASNRRVGRRVAASGGRRSMPARAENVFAGKEEAPEFDDAALDKLRPAAVRSIDESDPFK
jgi:serine/threonine-protein kinase